MAKHVPSTPRRLVAVAATLGVAASLTAAMSTTASATEDGARGADRQSSGDVLVRRAPRAKGSFTVRGASAESAGGLSGAARRDLRVYARSSGEDFGTLVRSHRGIDAFAEYVDGLERRNPGLYTASGISEDGGARWIQTTRRPGQAELARMKRLPGGVKVEFGAPASSAELARLSSELIDSVGEQRGVVKSAQTVYDEKAQRMVLTYKPTDAAPAARVTGAVEDALESSVPRAEGALPLPVVTREVDFETKHEVLVRGGVNLNFQGGAACTAGFTAARQGKRGVLTAAHCPNKMTYGGNQRGVLANKVATARNRQIDLQFHRSLRGNGHTVGVQFRAFAQQYRQVRRVTNSPRGSVVCHWGRTSGFSCARVRSTNQCVVVSGQKTCGLDLTNRYISAPGDSGGPWFLGNTARGIHTGGGGNTSLFTRISRTSAVQARVLQR